MTARTSFFGIVAIACFGLVSCPTVLSAPAPRPMPQAPAGARLTNAQFAASAFTRLASGDKSVAADIDWSNFRANGYDVGAKYRPFKSSADRTAFKNSFVESFSKSFKKTGATPEMVSDWKEISHTSASSTCTGSLKSGRHIIIKLSISSSKRLMTSLEPAK